jgi:transposase
MDYWAKPALDRHQTVLFSPTLDDSVGSDHPVRLLDEMLNGLDWTAWMAEYDGRKGQPPIPPWIMAGVILYGLMRGIRSSRMLEYLCGHNVDFVWLAEGRIIDHTTLCKFRTRFRGPLKELFRQLGKLSLQMGLIRLVEVAFDLAGMEERGVDFYTPMTSQTPEEGNPAKRSDPREPVAEEDRPKLPRNDKKKLAKSCFAYDEESDTYYCPMGRPLDYKETKKDQRGGVTVNQRLYRCADCAGCVLAGECLDPKAKRGRTVRRDEHEPLREKMAAKMRTAQGKAVYNQRMHIAETPFAIIKSILGVRRFLLRGLEKARTEWLWVCTAYNMRKLLAHVAGLRTEMAKKLATTAG